MNWLFKLVNKIFAFFATPAGSIVKEAVVSILERTQQEVLDLVFAEARTRVEAMDTLRPTASGDDKYDEVFAYLKRLLAERGITVGESVINFAIEAALQALKNNK
jgi:hypothetical protein